MAREGPLERGGEPIDVKRALQPEWRGYIELGMKRPPGHFLEDPLLAFRQKK
jgi:hypothetical protein